MAVGKKLDDELNGTNLIFPILIFCPLIDQQTHHQTIRTWIHTWRTLIHTYIHTGQGLN